MKCLLSVSFYPHMILLKDFDLLRDQKSIQSESRRSHHRELLSQPPVTEGRMVCTFVAAVIWRIRLLGPGPPASPALETRPQRDPAQTRAQARDGGGVLSLCFVAWRSGVPEWFPPWPVLPLRPNSGSPLPLLQALSNPCLGQSRRGPYPLTLRCIMPEQSPQGCETRRSCPWAGTGGDRSGSRGGEGAAGTVHRPGPRKSPGSRPPAPLGPTARPARRRRSHGGSS